MEMAAWVQAITAIVLVAVTSWYAYLTHRLLQAQVEPSIDLWISRTGLAAKVYNTGTQDAVDVRIDVEVVVHEHGNWAGGAIPAPWEPGADRPNAWKRLPPGAVGEIDLTVDAQKAVALAGMSSRTQRPGAPVQRKAALLLHVVFHRPVDRRRFHFTRTALPVFDKDGAEVCGLIDQDAIRPRLPSSTENARRG